MKRILLLTMMVFLTFNTSFGQNLSSLGIINTSIASSSMDMSDDGNVVVIGSTGSKTVKIYEHNGSSWAQKGSSITSTTSGFGYSVAISGDGTKVVIGNFQANSYVGEIHIYEFNGSSWVLEGTFLGNYTSSNSFQRYFGISVDISDDGKWVVVGAPETRKISGNLEGSIEIYYNSSGSTWTLKDTEYGSSNQELGYGVSISGDGARVAACTRASSGYTGSVRIYNKYSSGSLSLIKSYNGTTASYFGYDMDFSYDGKELAVGARSESSTGKVHIYKYTSSWASSPSATVSNQSTGTFGKTVAMSNDGSRIAVGGASNAMRVYVEVNNNWVQIGNDVTGGGYVGMSGDGSRAVTNSGTNIYTHTVPDPCFDPSAMSASNITTSSANLSWTIGGLESDWNVEWSTSPITPGQGATPTTTNSLSLNNLNENTQYYVYYQADCGNGATSSWATYNFTTLAICPVPSAMTLDSASHETVMVSWTAGDAETQWNIEWKAGGIFSPGTGVEDGSLVATTNTDVAITGLSTLTSYTLYYQADCGNGDESDWVGPVTFSTKGVGDGNVSVGMEVITGTTGGFSTSNVNMMEFNGKLLFSSTQGLYEYDGSLLSQVLDSNNASISTYNPIVVNNTLFFSNPSNSYKITKYDGTSVSVIQDINGNDITAYELIIANNTIYTSYTDYSAFPSQTYLFKYNGVYFEPVPNVSISGSFSVYNSAFYYIGPYPDYKLYKNINGVETEVTDASGASFGESVYYFHEYNGQLIVSANSKSWMTNGTTVTNIQDGTNTNVGQIPAGQIANGNLFFTRYVNSSQRLHMFNGAVVSEISTSSSAPSSLSSPSSPSAFNNALPISNVKNLTEIDDVLYFTATDATNGEEWRKYENGTVTLLADANPNTGSSIAISASGNMIASYNGSVFFNANNGTNGYELWKYDGTTAYMVEDIDAGSGNSSPADMIVYNEELYFTASTAATGRELFSYVEIPDSALITFSDPVACHNDSTLQVPITIDKITSDLGAISLVFDYDTTFMTYDTLASGHTNLNVVLGSNFYINDDGGKMYISWADNNIATIANGDTLFTLQFLPKNAATFSTIGSTLLNWDETTAENCELSDGLQEVLPSIYTDSLGKVIAPPVADLANDLTNNTLCELETAIFTASGGATYEFFVNDVSQASADTTSTYSSSTLLDNDVVSVFVIDEDGCNSDTSNTIAVRGLPDILLTNDNTDNRICSGDTVNFTATGASEYTFFLNNNEIQTQSIDSTYFIIPADGDIITVGGINTNTGCENDGDETYTLLLDGCFGTAGSIVYKNSAETPMGNVTVTLTSGVDTASVVTEVNVGTFNFTKLYDNETYTFSGITGKTHGGINSTDALGIIQHAINVSQISGLELKAADVDGIGSVNATDALLVMQRFVQSINSFDAGDWVFEDTSYTMTTDFTDQKIYSLAMGDVNGSYTPNISENSSVLLASNGDIKVNNGDIITLPVTVADAATIGAMSVAFYFPSHLMTINHVELANGENVIYNVQGDELRIAWADGSTLNLAAGDVLFNIEAIINDAADLANFPIAINNISEIANNEAIPFTNITLEMSTFAAITSINGVGTAAIPVRNFPNPFSTSTTIEYTLPTTGDVTLVIRNATGSEVRTIVNTTQTAGVHQVRINGDDLATGTYFYTIMVQENNRSYTVTKRMVVLK